MGNRVYTRRSDNKVPGVIGVDANNLRESGGADIQVIVEDVHADHGFAGTNRQTSAGGNDGNQLVGGRTLRVGLKNRIAVNGIEAADIQISVKHGQFVEQHF